MTIALAVTNLLTVAAFVWLLNAQQNRTWREVQVLCNRIQAPETAVAQTVAVEERELGPPDTEWREIEAHEALLDTYTEGS